MIECGVAIYESTANYLFAKVYIQNVATIQAIIG
jgi:hypothetical protein